MRRCGTEAKHAEGFRSVVSVLLRALGDFSLHPQGRPCGRPPAAAVLGRQRHHLDRASCLLSAKRSAESSGVATSQLEVSRLEEHVAR
jgi:hypothetical protein